MYDLDITAEGRRTPDRLTPKIREVVLAFVFDSLVFDSLVFDSLAVNPRRVGKHLRRAESDNPGAQSRVPRCP